MHDLRYGLSPQQVEAVVSLISGEAISSIVAKLGIDRSTLWGWREMPAFDAYYRSLRAEVNDDVERMLFAMVPAAGRAVQAAMDHHRAHPECPIPTSAVELLGQLLPGPARAPRRSAHEK